MKIAIVGGAGAMGSVFGAQLYEGGNDVTLVDVSQPIVKIIQSEGLTITNKADQARNVKVKATTSPSEVGIVDLVITFVKCYHTVAAIEAADPMIGENTTVLSLQNGWGNADRLAEIVGADRVVVGVTYHSASQVGPGVVRHNAPGITKIGELTGQITPRLEAISDVFIKSGLPVDLSATVVNEIWSKLALNVCTLPTSALLRFTAGELAQHDGTLSLMRNLLHETAEVAHAEGIGIDEDERWESIVALLNRAGAAKSSMLQDVENSRRTEIDVINGAILTAGKRNGINTAYNDSMVALVKALEETFQN